MRIIAPLLIALVVAGCGGGGGAGGASTPPVTPPPVAPSSLLPIVADAAWDETAVRQVLHTFAFGGHATDAQITAWADMSPRAAIDQILVLDAHHNRLSPPDAYDDLSTLDGHLESLRAHWESNAPRNRFDPSVRHFFALFNPAQGVAPDLTWSYSAVMRGVNPIRNRIGLWETNYHMAVHQQLGNVNDQEMLRYYDDIVDGLARGDAYEQVLAKAALSAAIASQYGHYKNVYVNGQFSGNEDFAREFHQLFFGILGNYDPVEHEGVTVKNTARALSGIQLELGANNYVLPAARFDAGLHDFHDLNILRTTIMGTTPDAKINQLAGVAINHQESLDNLPVMIIRGLADDNLDANNIADLRRAWKAMTRKDLLRFLRDYAISPLFHSAHRVKYLNSFERHLIAVNMMTLRNQEAYLDLYQTRRYADEGAVPFNPANNVFGGQQGTAAAASSAVFRSAYNRSTQEWVRFVLPSFTLPDGSVWEKDWRPAIPKEPSGRYRVAYIAQWLWQRFIADGHAHYGMLEKAQLHSLLATGIDFASTVDKSQPDRVYTAIEITNTPALLNLVNSLGDMAVALDDVDADKRHIANALVGQAANFIVATPYAFVLQGTQP